MSVEVIVGPPNSGRADEMRRRIAARLDRDPVLVVPTADDAARFERDLCEPGGAVLGVSIRTFASLFDHVARSAALSLPPPLSPPQRLALVRAAVRATPLRLLGRSSRRPGFAPALDLLIAELQGALLEPRDLTLAARDLEDGGYEAELAALFAAYVELRDRAGRGDRGSHAAATIAALREDPGRWAGAPLFVYGFDDLTEAQLALISALSRASEVVIAVNYADRDALAARAELLALLVERLEATISTTLGHDPTHTSSAALRHLDASLFEPEAGRVEPDGGLALIEAAGELGEAEAIGAEIARLLAAGEAPDAIAVVVRDPATRGPLIARTFDRFAIPVAVEASAPLSATAVGRSLAALCRALADDAPPELLAHLRADPATPPGLADRLERRIRRERPQTLDAALEGWERPPRHLAALRSASGAAGRMRALAQVAYELAQAAHDGAAPLAGRAGGSGVPFDPVEQRAAVAAAELVGELAEIGELPGCEPPDLTEAADAIASASVPLWRGPADGRVRVLDPYRIRAGTARHVFVAGLVEGEFPRRSPGDPLLGDDRRARLGLPALRRREALDEERYLFHACVSRPSERLWLSWQAADDDGAPAPRSPFVDEVLDLVGLEGSDPVSSELSAAGSSNGSDPAVRVIRRGLERVTFDPADAPSERELARAEALLGPRREERKPGPLSVPAVIEALAERELLSASTLEGWLTCPYRWFVEHELSPQRLDRESDALRLGSVAHDVLEQLYRDPPGADAIPRPADLGRWIGRLRELIASCAGDHGLDPERPGDAIALARLREQIETFLREEAESPVGLRPRPDLLEAGFGMEEDGPPPLAIGGSLLRGRIDRIDVDADGRSGLVRDYKTSREVFGRRGWESRGKLQLQLYMIAARERLGLEPLGGLYTALGDRGRRRPRGMLVAGDPRLEELETVGGDRCDRDDFEQALDDARERAGEKAAAMRAGRIARDPIGGRCPRYCTFQPVCRLERALGIEEEQAQGGNGAGSG